VQAYLQVKDVKGPVTEKEHKEWIYIHSFSFGVSNPNSGDPSREGKLVAGGAHYSDISLMKYTDVTTPLLASLCSQGKHVPEIKIEVCEDASKVNPVLSITLTDCLISSVQASAGGEKPMDSVSIAFAKIKVHTMALDEKGGKKAEADYTWDLLTKKLA